jgi:hypothetical protein
MNFTLFRQSYGYWGQQPLLGTPIVLILISALQVATFQLFI